MLVATHLATRYLGDVGVYSLAGIMGVTDVDPFILGMTQSSPAPTPLAAASNNVIKGIYAYAWSPRRAGLESLILLLGLGIAGCVPLLLL
jgi:uncharacterized membrane protein (DUF4010 family)